MKKLRSFLSFPFTFVFLSQFILNGPMAQATTIKEYIDGALRSNPRIEAAMAKVHSAEIGIRAARASYLPSGALSVGYTNTRTAMPDMQSKSLTLSKNLSVSWVLWDSGIRRYTLELAKLTMNNAELGHTASRQALIVQTLKTYALWDQQSSLEYIYNRLVEAMTRSIEKAKAENKLSEKSLEILEDKRDEWLQKKAGARILADTFAIQVKGLTEITPEPYVDSTTEEITGIAKFYEDLLFNKPLIPFEEARALMLANNLSLRASQKGVDATLLSQKLNRAATIGSQLVLSASTGSTGINSRTSALGQTIDGYQSQRSSSVGVSLMIPLNARSFIEQGKDKPDLRAVQLNHENLQQDLTTMLLSTYRGVSMLRQQTSVGLEELKKKKKFEFVDYSDEEVASLMTHLATFEQKYLVLNGQIANLFSSTIDFIDLCYDLEVYLRDLQ